MGRAFCCNSCWYLLLIEPVYLYFSLSLFFSIDIWFDRWRAFHINRLVSTHAQSASHSLRSFPWEMIKIFLSIHSIRFLFASNIHIIRATSMQFQSCLLLLLLLMLFNIAIIVKYIEKEVDANNYNDNHEDTIHLYYNEQQFNVFKKKKKIQQ